MQSRVGLARLECRSCACASYATVHSMLECASVSCLHCGEAVAVADIEAKNPDLSRLLGIMRQLRAAKAAHLQHGNEVAASREAEQAAARVEAQLV